MFSRDDLFLAKGLKKILDDGTFPLKAREVSAFAKVYAWAGDLEHKINKYIQENKMKPIEPKKKRTKKKKVESDGPK